MKFNRIKRAVSGICTLFLICIYFISTAQSPSPTLVSPNDQHLFTDNNPTFVWNVFPGVLDYTIEISTDSLFGTVDVSASGLTSTSFSTGSVASTTQYFWRVQAFTVIGPSLWSEVRSFQKFSPSDLSNLELWLRADIGVDTSVAGNVTQWNDQSGNNRHAIQTVVAKQPDYHSIGENGFPVVHFDGANQTHYLDISSSGAMMGSAFVLANWRSGVNTFPNFNGLLTRQATGSNSILFIGHGSSTNLYDGAGEAYFGNTHIYVGGTQTKNFIPIAQPKTLAGIKTPIPYDDFRIGNDRNVFSQNRRWQGDVAEIIVYGTELSPLERQTVELYLLTRSSPGPVELGANIIVDYGFCDMTLDAGEGFTSYLWSNGDTTQSITVNQTGEYSVTTTDIFGQTFVDDVEISFPQLLLTGDTLQICAGQSVLLNAGLGSDYFYTWSTGATTEQLNVTTPGIYSITVTDTLCSGQFISSPIVVAVDSFPITALLGPDDSLCSGNLIGLVSGSSTAADYLWSTSDTSAQIPITNTGQYSLTVTDNNGCVAQDIINVFIAGTAPAVNFSFQNVCMGNVASFADLSQAQLPDSVVSWHWDFGDGAVDSTNQHSTHLYSTSGTFTVTLTATTNSGCSASSSQTTTIHEAPAAQFDAVLWCTGTPYSFSDLSTAGTGDVLTSWQWTFGDGGTSGLQNPIYTYNTAGIYTAQLIINTQNGCVDSVSQPATSATTLPAPQLPSLISPVNHSVLPDSFISLNWNIANGAFEYAVYVSTDSSFSSYFAAASGLTGTNFSIGNLVSMQTYYWQAFAFNSCGDSTGSGISSFSVFNPASSPCIELWLRSDIGVQTFGTTVTGWLDNSGNSRDASPGSTEPTLVQNVLNGYPAIRLDGIDDVLDISSGSDVGSVFIVANWGGGNSTFPDFNGLMTEISNTANDAIMFIGAGNTTEFWDDAYFGLGTNINGIPSRDFSPLSDFKVISGVNAPRTYSDFRIGNHAGIGVPGGVPNRHWNGDIVEVIICNSTLPDNDREIIEQYLMQRYAAPVNLSANINASHFCDTVLDAGSGFVSYLWNTNDTTQTITVNQSGNYYVTVENVFGQSSTDTIHIQYPMPNLPPVSNICLNDTLELDAGLGSSYSYNWTGGATTEAIEVFAPGTYSLTITDQNACSEVFSVMVALDTFGNVISLGPDTGYCQGNMIGLASGANFVTGYLWSTGETTSTITLQTSGTYWVEATSVNGCVATDMAVISVSGVAPVADFAADTVCLGSPTTFTDLSFDNNSTITTWNWQFGDTNTASIQHPSHTYAQTGSYSVTLLISNANTCSQVITKTVEVNPVPTAAFNTSLACVNTSYDFADLSTAGANDSIVAWMWDFGDASGTSNLQHPSYTYSSASTYTVTLTVSTTKGCQVQTSNNIQVVASAPNPLPFSLIASADGAMVDTNSALLSWNQSTNATSYTLELDSVDGTFNNIARSFAGLAINSVQVNGLDLGTTYHWRVRAYNVCGMSSMTTSHSFVYFNPQALNGLEVWYAADLGVDLTGTNLVSQWLDMSGNQRHAQNSTASEKPLFVEDACGLKTIRFDGVDDQLKIDFPMNVATAFVVANWGSGSSTFPSFNGLITNLPTSTPYNLFITEQATTELSSQFSIFGFDQYINGTQTFDFTELSDLKIVAGTTQPFAFNDLVIGNHGSVGSPRMWNGDIAEIIIFGTELSSQDRQLVEDYLRHKYTHPVSLGPDFDVSNFCDTILDAGDCYIAYNWSTGDTTQTITVDQGGIYSVTVTGLFGATFTDQVVVNGPFISMSDTTICLGQSVTMHTGLPSGYTYSWHDNSTDSSFTTGLEGVISVTVTDASGCSAESGPVFIDVDSFAVRASLGTSDTSMCSGYFLGLVTGAEDAAWYNWSTGSVAPNIAVTSAGNYSLTATSVAGCVATDNINVDTIGTAMTCLEQQP